MGKFAIIFYIAWIIGMASYGIYVILKQGG
jgi:hypothetical protein